MEQEVHSKNLMGQENPDAEQKEAYAKEVRRIQNIQEEYLREVKWVVFVVFLLVFDYNKIIDDCMK